jgi:phage FluMu protein gp41
LLFDTRAIIIVIIILTIGGGARTKRRPTKVGLNDTLRRIRYLIVEGWSNLDIQNILQLEERTFYRYMAKVHQIDQALFAEQEKKTITTELAYSKIDG